MSTVRHIIPKYHRHYIQTITLFKDNNMCPEQEQLPTGVPWSIIPHSIESQQCYVLHFSVDLLISKMGEQVGCQFFSMTDILLLSQQPVINGRFQLCTLCQFRYHWRTSWQLLGDGRLAIEAFQRQVTGLRMRNFLSPLQLFTANVRNGWLFSQKSMK